MSERQLVMVVGSGRSGTSLFASILRELGYKVPKPEVPADQTNPRGFAEPQWLVDFHNEQLNMTGVHPTDARPQAWGLTAKACLDEQVMERSRSWLADKYRDSDHIVLKDPRLLWFTTLWESAAADLNATPIFVTMLRHPTEVVKSKSTWYSSQLVATNRTAGWLNTMLYTERATRGRTRTQVHFDGLLDDWAQTLGNVDEAVGIPLLHTARAAQLALADQLVDPSLVRSQATWDQLDVSPAVSDLAERLWKAYVSLSVGESDSELDDEFDAIRNEYRSLYQLAEDIAQSSLIAASRTRSSGGPPREKNHPGKPRLLVRIAKLVPPSIRHRFPEQTRRSLADKLG